MSTAGVHDGTYVENAILIIFGVLKGFIKLLYCIPQALRALIHYNPAGEAS